MLRVLAVDDDEINREIVSVMCHGAGYAFAEAADGLQAVTMIGAASDAGNPFDLILMDVLMPVMDGLTATKALRADPRFLKLPILGMTAKASFTDKNEMLEAGMNAVLIKPFKNKAFRRMVDEVFNGRNDGSGGTRAEGSH